MSRPSNCAIIIVTHNSKRYLGKCLNSIRKQTLRPSQIILIDNASNPDEIKFLETMTASPDFFVYLSPNNVGFCKANNIALSLIKEEIRYVLFLNPDAFLFPDFIEKAKSYMERNDQKKTAAISGVLLGFDIAKNCPTGKIDSSGIFCKWYGKWYDRHQGKTYRPRYFLREESVPALCGALMFCRKIALKSVMLSATEVWDNSFFMYKDDIDLSLRLRKKNWDLKFLPILKAYHCRGWQKNRKTIPKKFRLLSAKNEIKLFARLNSPRLIYSLIKYLSVKMLNI